MISLNMNSNMITFCMLVSWFDLEQNAMLWRPRPSISLEGCTVVSTKMPCDECSPVLYDCGIRRVVANTQVPKSLDDPARLRGLTYEKIGPLIPNIWEF
jgi:deoxycytidylate deaminase